jgi:N-acetyl-gamma-glutamyl-phosphate reductase
VIKIAILGASGYTGLELIRLLANHPHFKVEVITSRGLSGKTLGEVYGLPSPPGDLVFTEPNPEDIAKEVSAVFLCLPSGASSSLAEVFLKRGIKVVDLSADFRFKDEGLYKEAYGIDPPPLDLLSKAVYGLTEIYREEITKADLVGNPGCYPTSILLPLIPLFKEGLIEGDLVIADSKSGTSGAGRKADTYYSFCEVNEDFKPYKIASHRHTPEMEEKLAEFAKKQVRLVFTPHLLPLNRGIISTIYVRFRASLEEVHSYLSEFYRDSLFVEVLPLGRIPRLAEVRGTNLCKIALFEDKKRGMGIIVSALDNLVKGASGQAIQNLNLMFALPEDAGLRLSPILV